MQHNNTGYFHNYHKDVYNCKRLIARVTKLSKEKQKTDIVGRAEY